MKSIGYAHAQQWILSLVLSVTVVVIHQARAGLQLSEVMGDPSCSEYYAEFIELYCSGPDSVELLNYSLIVDEENDQFQFSDGNSRLAPGHRALVLDAGYADHSDCYEEIIPDSVLRLTISDASFGHSGIPNSRPVTIALLDGDGDVIDHMSYLADAPPGHSYECITFGDDEEQQWEWSLVEHGTPGLRNSVEPDSFQVGWCLSGEETLQLDMFNNGLCPLIQPEMVLTALYVQIPVGTARISQEQLAPGDTLHWLPGILLQGGWVELQLALSTVDWCDTLRSEWLMTGACELRFNEIMPDPGNTGPEWLELTNAHPQLPLNLRGMQLEDNCNGEPAPITGAGWFLAPGELVVITGDREDMLTTWGEIPLLEMSRMPLLGNGGDCLVLHTPAGERLEQLEWDSDWLFESGYSLERYNPGLANNRNGWSRSLSSARATPGAENSIRLEQLPAVSTHLISTDLLTPDGDGIDEVLVVTVCEVAWHLQFRVQVYNLIGSCVRHLDSGPHGAAITRLLWDGRDDDGRLLPRGAYLLLVEAAASGDSKPRITRHAVALYY